MNYIYITIHKMSTVLVFVSVAILLVFFIILIQNPHKAYIEPIEH